MREADGNVTQEVVRNRTWLSLPLIFAQFYGRRKRFKQASLRGQLGFYHLSKSCCESDSVRRIEVSKITQ